MSHATQPLFPQPQRLAWGEGWTFLDAAAGSCRLEASVADPVVDAAAARLRDALPDLFTADGAVTVTLALVDASDGGRDGETLPSHPEAYRLTVGADRVDLRGRGSAGVRYAVETFLRLVRREGDRRLVPRVAIEDWPDLRYRGLYVESKWGPDLMTLDDWRELIDLMAGWKFNTLGVGIYNCWGLQYPGERTEWLMVPFPGHPALQTPKDIAYHSPRAGGQVRVQYRPAMAEEDFFGDVVAYGKARNVTVRPHFNGPGHNTVIPREYPEVSAKDERGEPTGYGYCLSSDATYRLLFELYDSVIDRYLRPHGITWWHMAMDEVYPVAGIDLEDDRRFVDPWCKCPRCRERPHEELLLDFAFRCLRHLRDAGMDNITLWQDCLERMGVTAEFGRRLEREGLRPYVVVEWWRYNDPLPTPRSDISRTWVTPMAGYYHWMFHGSYLFNIAPFLERGYAHGAEGAEAYCTFDYGYQRNYLALAEWSWNRETSGLIHGFHAKYARWLFPQNVKEGAEALAKFDEVFGSPPARAMLDNLISYWYTYPARRIDFPREVYRRFLDDPTRTLVAVQACVAPLMEAERLLGALRSGATDCRIVDNLIFECRRVLAVIGAYTHGVRAIRAYQEARLDDARSAARIAHDGIEALLAEFEQVKPFYVQPQGMRDLTFIRNFTAALCEEVERAGPLAASGERVLRVLAE